MPATSTLLALELGLELAVPVVFTGAHSPPQAQGSDALDNLRNAVALTAGNHDGPRLPPGVMVLIGTDLHLPSRLTKVGTEPDPEGRYFFSFPEPVGQVSGGERPRLRLGDELLQRTHGVASWPKRAGELGIVELLPLDPFSSPAALADAHRRLRDLAPRRAGLVIQGKFAKNPRWSEFAAEIAAMSAAGIAVFLGSRHAFERLGKAPGRGLLHRSLSHATARLKLSWLLGTDAPFDDLEDWMANNLVGEIYRTEVLPQWIRYETLPEQQRGEEVVIAWPGMPAQVIADAAARLGDSGRRTLTLFGFGHGHLPGPNAALGELVGAGLRALPPGPWANLDIPAEARPDELVSLVANGLRAEPEEALAALLGGWTISERPLRSEWARAQAARATVQASQILAAQLTPLLTDPGLWPAGWMPRNPEMVITAAVNALGMRAQGAPPGEALSGVDLLSRVLRDAPEVVARRIVRDALVGRHPMLQAVGTAVDRGILVVVRTTASRGRTDHGAYEAGRMLQVLGARSQKGPGWETRGLRMNRPAAR
jgi:L-asparaginase/Glu-tRNA(Gln) amidotransferase subunit D